MLYRRFSPLGANSPGFDTEGGADRARTAGGAGFARAGCGAAVRRDGVFLRVPEVCWMDMPVPGTLAVAVRRPLELTV